MKTSITRQLQLIKSRYSPHLSSLLISLAILRSLLSECKRDVGLFASSAVKILEKALQVATKPIAGGGLDLEIAIRTVTVVCHCYLGSVFRPNEIDDILFTSVHLLRDLRRWRCLCGG